MLTIKDVKNITVSGFKEWFDTNVEDTYVVRTKKWEDGSLIFLHEKNINYHEGLKENKLTTISDLYENYMDYLKHSESQFYMSLGQFKQYISKERIPDNIDIKYNGKRIQVVYKLRVSDNNNPKWKQVKSANK